MVIERFKDGHPARVGERFARRGRMLPDGVTYEASWMGADGACCYQLMQGPSIEALNPWIAAWSDLVDFEVVPVIPSVEFWARHRS